MKNSDFDMDLKNGQAGENAVWRRLNSDMSTVEVKRDGRWFDTDNLYIETECYYNRSQSWEPSGLSVTKALVWVFVLGDLHISLPTENLRDMIETKRKVGTLREINCVIPPNPSRGVLITVQDLLNYQRRIGPGITNE